MIASRFVLSTSRIASSRRAAVRAITGLKDREHAVEQAWVNAEDARLLRSIAERLRTAKASPNGTAANPPVSNKEVDALKAIVPNLNEEQIKKLVQWRHSVEY